MAESARNAVLAAIERATHQVRDADPAAAHDALTRGYRQRGGASLPECLERLEERLEDYGVRVTRTTADGLPAAVAAWVAERGVQRWVVPPGVPEVWLSSVRGVEAIADDAGPRELDGADAVVTSCAVAVAETGSIVLDAGPGQGRRAATLVPDVHLCVVPASLVVELVPEAVAGLADAVTGGRPLTWISGPSATSDIELVRVAGVHGPRTLAVLLVEDA